MLIGLISFLYLLFCYRIIILFSSFLKFHSDKQTHKAVQFHEIGARAIYSIFKSDGKRLLDDASEKYTLAVIFFDTELQETINWGKIVSKFNNRIKITINKSVTVY